VSQGWSGEGQGQGQQTVTYVMVMWVWSIWDGELCCLTRHPFAVEKLNFFPIVGNNCGLIIDIVFQPVDEGLSFEEQIVGAAKSIAAATAALVKAASVAQRELVSQGKVCRRFLSFTVFLLDLKKLSSPHYLHLATYEV